MTRDSETLSTLSEKLSIPSKRKFTVGRREGGGCHVRHLLTHLEYLTDSARYLSCYRVPGGFSPRGPVLSVCITSPALCTFSISQGKQADGRCCSLAFVMTRLYLEFHFGFTQVAALVSVWPCFLSLFKSWPTCRREA